MPTNIKDRAGLTIESAEGRFPETDAESAVLAQNHPPGLFISQQNNVSAAGALNWAGGVGVFASGGAQGILAKGGTDGVYGETKNSIHAGVAGYNRDAGFGIWGGSASGDGVHGEVNNERSAVAGYNTGNGFGVWGYSVSGVGVYGNGARLAGQFEGDVEVSGTVTCYDCIINRGRDCAEQFELLGDVDHEPGTVMVIGKEGRLAPCRNAYDRKVAGVLSGAGEFKAGLILGGNESSAGNGLLALMGRVYCKVDANYSSIEEGDLLTTSPTDGHAMKATNQGEAFGAILGKAMRSLPSVRCHLDEA